MTTLQWILLGAGVLIILGVVAYNKWLEHRLERQTQRAFHPTESDPLLSSSRSEYALNSRAEPHLKNATTADRLLASSVVQRGFNEQFEQIVSLSFDQPVSGEVLLDACNGFEQVGNKPVEVAGTHVDTHKLELLYPDALYSGLHIGVLLANRSGALSDIEYSQFIQGVQRIAEQLEVAMDVPEMDEVLARAQVLDDTLAKLDKHMVIHVVANAGYWPQDAVACAALEAGFSHRPEGYFLYYRSGAEVFRMRGVDPEGRALAVLPGMTAAIAALSITLDVPRAPEIETPFETLITVARAMAARLGASVVDDYRRVVTDVVVAQVDGQLKALYGDLREAQVEAGSDNALRLFA